MGCRAIRSRCATAQLVRNGRSLTEPYVEHTEPDIDPAPEDFRWQRDYLVEARANATVGYHPSRNNWGPLVVPAGNYFVLGDNRDNSLDSRYWGFVADSLVKGRPFVIYYSYAPDTRGLRLAHSTFAGSDWASGFTDRYSSSVTRNTVAASAARTARLFRTKEPLSVWPPPATKKSSYEEGSLDQYLRDISAYPLISRDEEVRLAQRIRQGDQEALDKLVRSNLRFVVSVAKKYQNQGVSLSDLINEGNLGLIRAAHKFDETKGIKFISYAVWWIRQAILQALAEQSRIVRVPLNRAGTLHRIGKRANALLQELGRERDARGDRATAWTSPRKKSRRRCRSRRRISRSMRR